MNSRPLSSYTYPKLIDRQLQKADVGSSGTSVATEYDTYYDIIEQYIFDFSKVIEAEVNRTFVPYYATKTYYFSDILANGSWHYTGRNWVLFLDEDLMSVTSITVMATIMETSSYRLLDAFGSTNGYPYSIITFDINDLPSWNLDFDSKIEIVGEWGCHDNVNDVYTNITTLATSTTSSATTLNVTSATSIYPYQYLKIDDEMMQVLTVNTDSNPDEITVKRGVNGYTAASHDVGVDVDVLNVVRDVQQLATRVVAYWYTKRNDVGDRIQIIDDSLFVGGFSKELHKIAKMRKRSHFGTAR